MTDNEEDLLIKAVVAGVAIFGLYRVGKYLANQFGIHPENTALVNAQIAKPADQNAFSTQFKPFRDDDGQSKGQSWAYEKQLTDQALLDPGKYQSLLSVQPAVTVTRGEKLWDSFSFFKDTDYNAIFAVFNNLASKEDVAELAQFMNDIYNVDLLNFLRYGIYRLGPINFGLNDNQMADIINHVNSLPDTA